MGEFVKGECSHCGQPVEFPSEGTGQTVPCPTCHQPFVLKPAAPPATRVVAPPTLPPPDLPAPPAPKLKEAPRTEASPFDRACLEFERNQEFAGRSPTREEVGRAWARVKFRKADASEPPTHADLVAALKEMFPEFKDPKPSSTRPRPDKLG